MSNNNRATTPYYIFLLCTPTWPSYLLSFEPLGIECKPRIVVIYIINIIVIVRFSPVLLGLLCNCHVSATSRSLETQDFLNMRAVPRMGDNCVLPTMSGMSNFACQDLAFLETVPSVPITIGITVTLDALWILLISNARS